MGIAARVVGSLVAAAAAAGIGWGVWSAYADRGATAAADKARGPVPVEVAAVERGRIEQVRELTGTLEAAAELVVAAKVGGRVEQISVDLGDFVQRGQIVARIEGEEYAQIVAEARAELAVAHAQRGAAAKALEIARRDHDRIADLHAVGTASEQELDLVRAARLEAEAAVSVAASGITRAQASVRAAEAREDYTLVAADWTGQDETRVVAARHVDEGTTIAANTPLLTIVDLDPITVVLHVTERDYAAMQVGQLVTLTTDAHPGETFGGRVARIAPVFREESRQARVELTADNPDARLKPGMFVRASTVLRGLDDATIVPRDALLTRDDSAAVFVVSPDGTSVSLRPVTAGIVQGERVAVEGQGIAGRVVTLGQQQLVDGSAITIVEPAS